jgi:hypothetical protein
MINCYSDLPPNQENETMLESRARWALRKGIAVLTVKRKILEKHDVIPLFITELVNEFGYLESDIKKNKLKIIFSIPCEEVNQEEYDVFLKKLSNHVNDCIKTKWGRFVVFEKGTLQAMIMESLKKPEFKFAACIHYSAKYGAQKTFDDLALVKEWSLLY